MKRNEKDIGEMGQKKDRETKRREGVTEKRAGDVGWDDGKIKKEERGKIKSLTDEDKWHSSRRRRRG